MSAQDQVTMTPTEELLKQSKELKELAVGIAGENKTRAEAFEEFSKRLVTLEEEMTKANKHAVFPEYDPIRLKFEADKNGVVSQKSFESLMRSKPVSDSGAAKNIVTDLQRVNDKLRMLMIFGEACRVRGGSVPAYTELKAYKEFQELGGTLLKALDTTTAGSGLEWVPTLFSQEIMGKIKLQLRVAALFRMFDMPSNPYKWPFIAARPVAQVIHAQPDATDYGKVLAETDRAYGGLSPTANTQFDAGKLRALEVWVREFDEDTVSAALDVMIEDMISAIGDGWEDGIINGDTDTSTHIDSDVTEPPTGTSPKTFVDGLRKYALETATGATSDEGDTTLTDALIRAARQKMGNPWATQVSQLAYIVDIKSYFQMLSLSGHQTLNDMGPQAAILTGMVGSHDNIPVILSEFARSNLNASGVYDGITTDQGAILIVHRQRWLIGKRPASGLETDRWVPSDQGLAVVFDRGDFQLVDATPAAGGPVGYLYNVPSI